jgi:hypothetical protein
MHRNRRIMTVLAVLAAALGIPLVDAGPAMAYGTRPASCNTASLCFYVNDQFRDGPGKLTQTSANLGVYAHRSCGANSNYSWNNCMTSVWNATSACWHIYDLTGTTGGYHNLGPNDGYTNLGTQGDYNDRVSSVKRGSGRSCSF